MKTSLVLMAAALAVGGATASGASVDTLARETTRLEVPRVNVPARANIFGAGRSTPPDPGGGGAGILPPSVQLPVGQSRVVTIPRVLGRVNPINWNNDWNGPQGDRVGPTDVTSYRGISGLVDRHNGMFLVGVFLSDAGPPRHAPPRLDFTDREDFSVLAPRLAQTFMIGNGKGHEFRVPSRATRLLLGFADGFLYQGLPGWYDNNSGGVVVSVHMTRG